MNDAPVLEFPRVADIDRSVEFHTVHGYRRAVRVAGSGEPIVLLHGFTDSSLTWRSVFAQLATRYRVIAPDLLGHGLSDKPRADYSVAAYANGLRDLLTVLGVERATMIGHSLGGAVVAQFAYQFPERVDRLVLVCAAGLGTDLHPGLRLMASPVGHDWLRLFRVPGVAPAANLLGGLASRGYQATGRSTPSILADLAKVVSSLAGLADPGAYRASMRILRSSVDWRGQGATTLDRCYLNEHLPVQIVWGANDGIIPVSHAYNAHAAMPGSRLVVFERAGHMVFDSDPDRFIGVVDDFMASTPPAEFDSDGWRSRLVTGARGPTDAADASERFAT